jgi:hypothetical protein
MLDIAQGGPALSNPSGSNSAMPPQPGAVYEAPSQDYSQYTYMVDPLNGTVDTSQDSFYQFVNVTTTYS